MKSFDVIISVGVKDIFIVKKNIYYVNKNINPRHIYLLLNKKFFRFYSKHFLESERVTLLDESLLIPGLDIEEVRKLVNSHFLHGMRGGWYFQQFLKMGFALSDYATEYYLIWDADTIPTSPLVFFDEKDRMLITKKTEYHLPYFETMQRLINMGKSADFSFIAEHMIIKTEYMKELIRIISQNSSDKKWYEIIIDAVNPKDGLGFSEFETYGTFVYNKYPDDFIFRKLHTFRRAGCLFGRCMTNREINEFNGVTDTISLEAGHIPPFPRNIGQYVQLGFLYLLKP